MKHIAKVFEAMLSKDAMPTWKAPSSQGQVGMWGWGGAPESMWGWGGAPESMWGWGGDRRPDQTV